MRLALLLFALLFVGCERDDAPALAPIGSGPASTTVSALDTLSGEVSINGRVIDQRAGDRTLVLDDGTGLIRVELPEALPVLVGQRLFVQGTVRRADGAPVLEADDWLYDSTAVSVRSE
jgi:uncharacterized protein YdeI (BOF family)